MYEILKDVDAEGLEQRRRKRFKRHNYYGLGPMERVSFDGHDKVPYIGETNLALFK